MKLNTVPFDIAKAIMEIFFVFDDWYSNYKKITQDQVWVNEIMYKQTS